LRQAATVLFLSEEGGYRAAAARLGLSWQLLRAWLGLDALADEIDCRPDQRLANQEAGGLCLLLVAFGRRAWYLPHHHRVVVLFLYRLAELAEAKLAGLPACPSGDAGVNDRL